MRDGTVSTALARAGMAHRGRAAALLAEVGLHPGQEFLLGALWREGPLPVGALADALGVEQPTVTKMVNRMAAAGLVERDRDPADARRVLVAPTDRSTALRPAVEALWSTLEDETTAGLDAAEARQLAELLGRVRVSLDADRAQ